jgi:hypothetical protein
MGQDKAASLNRLISDVSVSAGIPTPLTNLIKAQAFAKK